MTRDEHEPDGRWEDPVVAEVRQAREALFAASGYDLEKLSRTLRLRQSQSDREVVRVQIPFYTVEMSPLSAQLSASSETTPTCA